jgi:non-heme chloroperoxidase
MTVPTSAALHQAGGAPVPVSVGDDGIVLHHVERGSGTPVVLVHGSLADYTYWEWSGQIPLLADQHRVIAYSRRYNYPNTNPRGVDHSAMVEARDLAAFLDALGLGPVHLVGHSYGAYTSLVCALDNPERVRSLVLAEPPIISWLPDIPAGEGIYEGFMEGIWEPLARAFTEGGTAAGLDFTARWYFEVPWAEVTPEWQTLFSRNVEEWHALAVSAHTFPKLDAGRVSALAVPTLLLSGGKNALGFNDLIDGHLERLLPNATRVIIPGASHEMFLDDRTASAAAMLEFFQRH